MKSNVAPSAATPDPGFGRQGQRPRPQSDPPGNDRASEPAAADLRLIIEENAGPDACIYTVIDRRTGEVVQRLTRDEVLRLSEDQGYEAGGVIRTKA